MEICLISCVARYTHDNYSIVQTLPDCSTYIVKLSRKALMMASPVRTSCAFTALHCSMISTQSLQASHRHCKLPAPGWHHTRAIHWYHTPSHPTPTPNSAMPAISKKRKNVKLHNHIAINWGKSAAEAFQTHHRPFLWLRHNWDRSAISTVGKYLRPFCNQYSGLC